MSISDFMPITYYQARWATPFRERLIIAESRRNGGVSEAPFTSLNLSPYTKDNLESVNENRRLFATELGFDALQLAGGLQVHGTEVLQVEEAGQVEGYDAFVTNKPGLVLSVTVADCCPVLIFDPVQSVVGAAHAGWKGTVGQIAQRTLNTMEEAYGTQARDCWAFVGTCISAEDFEVDADVADHFSDKYKYWKTNTQKFHVDLKAANRNQLLALGMSEEKLECSPYSTISDNQHYFSHRAGKGTTGRMLAVIGLRNRTRVSSGV